MVLRFSLDPDIPKLKWTEAVRTSYSPSEPLPKDIENSAIERGIKWYGKSKLLVSEEMDQRIKEVTSQDLNGTLDAQDADEPITLQLQLAVSSR